jgi:hypothetical protein
MNKIEPGKTTIMKGEIVSHVPIIATKEKATEVIEGSDTKEKPTEVSEFTEGSATKEKTTKKIEPGRTTIKNREIVSHEPTNIKGFEEGEGLGPGGGLEGVEGGIEEFPLDYGVSIKRLKSNKKRKTKKKSKSGKKSKSKSRKKSGKKSRKKSRKNSIKKSRKHSKELR